MKLKAQFQAPRISASYRQTLQESLTHELVKASQAYLHAVADALIPVYGGASRATFSQLASHAEFALTIDPVGPNTVELGAANGQCAWLAGPSEYSFTYTTTLPHLIINEYQNANEFQRPGGGYWFHLHNPGPYHFQEAGEAAFYQSLSTLDLPALRLESITIAV